MGFQPNASESAGPETGPICWRNCVFYCLKGLPTGTPVSFLSLFFKEKYSQPFRRRRISVTVEHQNPHPRFRATPSPMNDWSGYLDKGLTDPIQ